MLVEVAGSHWHGGRRVSIQNVSVCAGKTPPQALSIWVFRRHTRHTETLTYTRTNKWLVAQASTKRLVSVFVVLVVCCVGLVVV